MSPDDPHQRRREPQKSQKSPINGVENPRRARRAPSTASRAPEEPREPPRAPSTVRLGGSWRTQTPRRRCGSQPSQCHRIVHAITSRCGLAGGSGVTPHPRCARLHRAVPCVARSLARIRSEPLSGRHWRHRPRAMRKALRSQRRKAGSPSSALLSSPLVLAQLNLLG